MKTKLLTGLFLALATISTAAHAAEALKADTSEAGMGISLVDKVQVLVDSQIDTLKIASIADGPAMNPEHIAVELLATEQYGDVANFDVYRIDESFAGEVKTARIVGDYLVLTADQSMPDDSQLGFKNIQKTIRVQIKAKGKRLAAPIVQSIR